MFAAALCVVFVVIFFAFVYDCITFFTEIWKEEN